LCGRIQACGWLQVDFGHGSDVSTTERRSRILKEENPALAGFLQSG
jgi:hypothetical protein